MRRCMKQQNIEQPINDRMTKLTFVLLAIVISNAVIESRLTKEFKRSHVVNVDRLREFVTQYDQEASNILQEFSQTLDVLRHTSNEAKNFVKAHLKSLCGALNASGAKLETSVLTELSRYIKLDETDRFSAVVRRLINIAHQTASITTNVPKLNLPTVTRTKEHLVSAAMLAIDELAEEAAMFFGRINTADKIRPLIQIGKIFPKNETALGRGILSRFYNTVAGDVTEVKVEPSNTVEEVKKMLTNAKDEILQGLAEVAQKVDAVSGKTAKKSNGTAAK